MNRIAKCILLIAAVASSLFTPGTHAQQVPLPKTATDVPGPAYGTALTKQYVQMVGRMAYVWGYAMVSAHNRRAAFASVPSPGLDGGVFPIAPVGRNAMLADTIKSQQAFIACPDPDAVYGAGFFALEKEPVVFQVPDFGDRFWVYGLYDARTDAFAEIGRLYGTEPGFYLMVGPNWKGEPPQGINAVVRSSTELVFAVPRVFKNDTPEDTRAVQPLIDQVMFYPLSRFDGKMKTTNWARLPHLPPPAAAAERARWVSPEDFYDQLPEVMRLVPPLPGEEALYGWITGVFEAAARDPATRKTLVESFVSADKELVAPLLRWHYSGRSAGNGWNSQVNNAQWGIDYINRTAAARSNIFANTPGETKALYRDLDSGGQQLLGKNSYKVTFRKGQLPPVKGSWSLALYNEQHLFHPNALDRYSLGTRSKSLQANPDGSLTLYFGANSPGKAMGTNWVPAPAGKFSLVLRAYWAKEALLGGTWAPPNVEKLKLLPD
jgi:hypothetical protein